ncbi:flavin reductase family protein [Acidovorax sp. T1]|uniref:flavin reductase family protein n=1 Tax=Acidovorax sp. T1 TaxID=1858609 RepID=UPI000B3FCCE9|nr:flavin reductase family protein [Acidovorax sp. T1]
MTTIELQPVGPDPLALRSAYGCFPSGVTAIGSIIDGAPDAIIASSFTSVSLDPPLVSVCVQDNSTTWPKLANSTRLGVSILADEHVKACRQIAAKVGDRFAGLAWTATEDGAVLLENAAAWLDCSIYQTFPAGDHVIVVLQVHELLGNPEASPLVFHGSSFRQLSTA